MRKIILLPISPYYLAQYNNRRGQCSRQIDKAPVQSLLPGLPFLNAQTNTFYKSEIRSK